jgi:uncharacterized protein (TIGR03435 family)
MNAWLHILGWVLIHFVWQGAVLAIAAFVVLRWCVHQPPSVRYAIACGTLMMMLTAAAATAVIVGRGWSESSPGQLDVRISPAVPLTVKEDERPLQLEALTSFVDSMRHGRAIEALFPWIVSTWLVGITLLLLRTFAGWWRVRRLHRIALVSSRSRWQAAANRIASRLGLRRAIRIVELAGIDVPLVVGCLRPVVVLPIAAFSHLSPAQADAILAHELAHIRRHDYLINLMQTLAETLLFYHPGVWWISARIRNEREDCCDDVAVAVCGDPVGYAAALAELENRRSGSPHLAPAATGGSLLNRVRRILHAEIPHQADAPHWIVLCALAAVLVAAGVWRLDAQGPDLGERRTFEVASVKPNTSGDTRASATIQPGGRYNAINELLRNLIINAYRLQESQLAGVPDWTSSERFDIVAKAEGDEETPLPVVQSMVRSLLAERFKLAVHWESREGPIYTLVRARTDGKLGPGIKPSAIDCAALAAARRGAPPPSGPPPRLVFGERPACGAWVGFGELAAGSRPLDELVSLLAQTVRRTVVDRTGLTGKFDFYMKWTPDNLPPRAPGTPADLPVRVNGVEFDPNGPSIFTALQEQLGLRLESTRGPIDVLVIDHVERPSPD